MIGGSVQLRQFRIAIRDGASLEDACAQTGISESEARLIVKADESNPPPAEAYTLIGHNSKGPNMDNTAGDQLRLFIERIERLEEEKKGIGDDIRDVYSEAKSQGYDPKIMRKVIALRKMKPDDRAEMEAILETYQAALGMLVGTPLGDYAMSRAA